MNETTPRGSTPALCVIAFEYPPFPGGIASYAHNLATEASAFTKVSVVAPVYPDTHDTDLPVSRLLSHHKLTLRGLFSTLRHIARLDRNTLNHAADIRAAIICLVARILMGRHYIVMAHGSDVAKFDRWSPSKLVAWAVYFAADRVLSNSDFTKSIYDRNFPRCAPCFTVPLGVGEDWFVEPAGAFEHPDLAAIPESAEVICTVGRLEPRKGHLLALDAIAEYQATHPEKTINYVVCGRTVDKIYEQAIRDKAAALGIDMKLAGAVSRDDLGRLYRRASMQLLCALPLPGKIEGFGLVLLEAAALGCPSVATRSGGISEVVADGETGILVGSETAKAIAGAIHDLNALKEKIPVAQLCRAHARKFSWAETARRTYSNPA
ncbi:glycosyl transferase group 1 [Parvibaculum lavamentivorans DS-1]|uniref:Glycosyl transferase group 1 n=1 Tax=Parvibaculum lavamentivorans (strain DS-1 / DSM 13023 / NCIMB 13966) TaxID=402881 RepID=A7HUE8_PARL1|nr:glycosyltransferase family 4 protein [Parvibaculum lavamentivorans]ABS63531.1 glycosyl transferase group 1 [Parvibaculum lavamentivorans DS-1]